MSGQKEDGSRGKYVLKMQMKLNWPVLYLFVCVICVCTYHILLLLMAVALQWLALKFRVQFKAWRSAVPTEVNCGFA